MANKSTPKSRPSASEHESGSPLEPRLPRDEHEEELIDEALTETFPASDPVAVPTPDDKLPPPKDEGRRAKRARP